jgi:hypothetical protein
MKIAPPTDQEPASKADTGPTDEEAIRFFTAFSRIIDPDQQAEILALAIRYAGGSLAYDALVQRMKTRH